MLTTRSQDVTWAGPDFKRDIHRNVGSDCKIRLKPDSVASWTIRTENSRVVSPHDKNAICRVAEVQTLRGVSVDVIAEVGVSTQNRSSMKSGENLHTLEQKFTVS